MLKYYKEEKIGDKVMSRKRTTYTADFKAKVVLERTFSPKFPQNTAKMEL